MNFKITMLNTMIKISFLTNMYKPLNQIVKSKYYNAKCLQKNLLNCFLRFCFYTDFFVKLWSTLLIAFV